MIAKSFTFLFFFTKKKYYEKENNKRVKSGEREKMLVGMKKKIPFICRMKKRSDKK